jgi:hypothetical protein
MQRRDLLRALALAAPGSLLPLCARALSQADAASGVRLALQRGAEAALSLLGRPDGYLGNAAVRIALPSQLNDAAKLMRRIGQGKRVDELETAMNRAAEAAVPEARTLLLDAVKNISVDDGLRIVRGGDTAVTEFFVRQTRAPLTDKFLPIVTTATEKVSLAEKYNAVAGKASGMGLVKQEDANIQQYVTRKALDGLYLVIGEEEKKIRADPVGSGSALLKTVFGK